jgi:hypothetical protein
VKLPNADRAIIDSRKITDYCLDPEHEDGQHKAHLFKRLLGIDLGNAQLLLDALQQAALGSEAVAGKQDKYGDRYVIDFELSGPAGIATIRSAWMIRAGEDSPRLVTCYIL